MESEDLFKDHCVIHQEIIKDIVIQTTLIEGYFRLIYFLFYWAKGESGSNRSIRNGYQKFDESTPKQVVSRMSLGDLLTF